MNFFLRAQSLLLCLSILIVSQITGLKNNVETEQYESIIEITQVEEPKFNHSKPLNILYTVQYFRPKYDVSSSYSKSKFYQQLLNVEISDDIRTNIVNIAKSQVGYIEGNYPGRLSGENKEDGNYTEYGYWYGMQDEWCAMFVSWCTALAGNTNVPKHASCNSGLKKFIKNGLAYTRQDIIDGKYIPKPGDVIYFCSSSAALAGKLTTHVGLVTEYKDGYIYTIEGNTTPNDKSIKCGGIVETKKYSIKNTYVAYICETI